MEIIVGKTRNNISQIILRNSLPESELINSFGGTVCVPCTNVCYESVRLDCPEVTISAPQCPEFTITTGCMLFLQCPGTEISCNGVVLQPWP